jgi:hypothetical protein
MTFTEVCNSDGYLRVAKAFGFPPCRPLID